MDTVSDTGTLMLMLLSGCVSQNITFPSNVTQQISSCKDGSRIDGVDRIKHFGQVETGGISKRKYVGFETRNGTSPTSFFIEDCALDVDVNGCGDVTGVDCYCARQDTNTSYTLVYNRPADIAKSEYLLRLRWQTTTVYSEPPVQMPLVRRKMGISVTCGGKKCSPLDGTQSNPYTFCVSNLDSPALTIEIGGRMRATANSSCILYSILNNETNSALVLHYVEGTGCQRSGNKTWLPAIVTLHPPMKQTTCAQGVREDDILKITGTLRNVNIVNLKDWTVVEFVTRAETSVDFVNACNLSLLACGSQLSILCDCLSNSSDVYDVYFKTPAELLKGVVELKIVWRKVTAATATKETAPETVPVVYGKHSALLTLTVNDEQKTTQSCELPRAAKIRYCCTNSPSPCNLRIQYGGKEITGSSCISHTVAATDKYTFSYSVCDATYNEGIFTCSVGPPVKDSSMSPGTVAMIAGISLLSLLVFALSVFGFYKVLKKLIMRTPVPPTPPATISAAALTNITGKVSGLQAAEQTSPPTGTNGSKEGDSEV